MADLRIRPFARSDAAALYDICLRTSAAGADATEQHDRPELPGEVYVGPYLAHHPELAYVLADGDRPVGYTLGALDTRAFEEWAERSWWPGVRARYPDGLPRTADEELRHLAYQAPLAPDALVAAYPSHLHIDLLPVGQGGGHGRRLLETLLDALRERGSPGVHLGVDAANTRAVGFYRHLGFEPVPNVEGLWLVRRVG